MFAHGCAGALTRYGVIAAVAHGPAGFDGFAYGFPWRWDEQTDAWAEQLRHRLGEPAATRLDGTYTLAYPA